MGPMDQSAESCLLQHLAAFVGSHAVSSKTYRYSALAHRQERRVPVSELGVRFRTMCYSRPALNDQVKILIVQLNAVYEQRRSVEDAERREVTNSRCLRRVPLDSASC